MKSHQHPLLWIAIGLALSAPALSNSMAPTLREKLGQLLCVGFRGTEASDESHVVRDVLSQGVGGVLLYERDTPTHSKPRNIVGPEQVQRLVSQLQARSKVPLFVAIDQEGGQVVRFKANAGFPSLPSAKSLGRMSYDSARKLIHGSAKALADAGVNLNFAPVVDLDVDTLSKAVGALERSFGPDTATVLRLSRIFADAQRENGVLSTLKHFPGQGSGRGDTHQGFVDVTGTWNDSELVPFRRLVQEGRADMVMTSHIFNARLDSLQPATLSGNTVTGLLRRKLAWDGVVITDDLQMEAIRSRCDLKESLALALEAGADILLLGNSTAHPYDSSLAKNALSSLESLVHSGRISEARIDSSWHRVMALKTRLPKPRVTSPIRILWMAADTACANLRKAIASGDAKIDEFPSTGGTATEATSLDSLLGLRPDAVVVPAPTDSAESGGWPLAGLVRSAVLRRPEGLRPAIFASLRDLDSARQVKRFAQLARLDPSHPDLRMDTVWWACGVVLDSTRFHRRSKAPLERLIPLASQNAGRLFDVASTLRERM